MPFGGIKYADLNPYPLSTCDCFKASSELHEELYDALRELDIMNIDGQKATCPEKNPKHSGGTVAEMNHQFDPLCFTLGCRKLSTNTKQHGDPASGRNTGRVHQPMCEILQCSIMFKGPFCLPA